MISTTREDECCASCTAVTVIGLIIVLIVRAVDDPVPRAFDLANANVSSCRAVHVVSNQSFDATYAVEYIGPRRLHASHAMHRVAPVHASPLHPMHFAPRDAVLFMAAGAYVRTNTGDLFLLKPAYSSLLTPNATYRLNMSAFHRDAQTFAACVRS